jgi:hypothetical protein
MLKKQFAFLALIPMIINISCSYTPRSEVPTLLTSISQSLTSLTSKITLKSSEDFISKKIEPNFKDEKLAYIYKNREQLGICEEGKIDKRFAESDSKVYQIDSRTYILQFGCHQGAYFLFFQYLLYSITDYGIELKTLPMLTLTHHIDLQLFPLVILRLILQQSQLKLQVYYSPPNPRNKYFVRQIDEYLRTPIL